MGHPVIFWAHEWGTWLSSGLIAHGYCAGGELEAADESQVEAVRQAGEERWSVTGYPGLHGELVLVDQSQVGQGQRELYASDEQALAWLLFELLNGLP